MSSYRQDTDYGGAGCRIWMAIGVAVVLVNVLAIFFAGFFVHQLFFC